MTRENSDQRAANQMRSAAPDSALAVAIRRGDWERAGLLLLVAMAEVTRSAPAGTIDDLLALLSDEEVCDEHLR